MEKNYYIVLGISRGASKQNIKQAYREMAKRYHPDSGGSEIDEAKFLEIQKAYETLSDGERRAVYDAAIARPVASSRPRGSGRITEMRPSVRENQMRRRSFVDDFFEGWLPGRYHPRPSGRLEKELAIEMTLEPSEARDGGLFPLTVPVVEPCPRCGGSGVAYPFVCSRCHGNGRIETERHFSVSIPPYTKDRTDVTLPLDDIGLNGVRLHLFIRVAM